MLRLILRRLVRSVPLLLVVSAVSFVIESLVPGDVARDLTLGLGTPAEIKALRIKLGLNHPVWYQYLHYLSQLVLHGSLGTDAYSGQAVTTALAPRLPVTLSLVILTTLFCAVVGMALGIASAVYRGYLGKFVDFLSVAGFALPAFWVALVLQNFFTVDNRFFPSVGYISPSTSISGWLHCMALPVVSISLGPMAIVAKQSRDSMKDVLEREYIRTLRACGVSRARILWKHALRNAVTPALTVVSLVFISALSFSVFAETVFALPGLGSLAVSATQTHDVPIIEGITMIFTLLVVAVNLIMDVCYALINPRIRLL
jgi:peptide/nickel transport system permease protein